MTGVFDDPIFAGLFGDPEVAAHLTPEAEIAAMIRFEVALAIVEARLGIIPSEAGDAIAAALPGVAVEPADLAAGTRSAGVPVPALVAALREAAGAPHGAFIHWGATSQDVWDTGFVLRLVPILGILERRLVALVGRLGDAARTHARLPMAGRTRSQVATPTTLGLRIAGWVAPLGRCLDRLAEMRSRVLAVQLGGASGNLSILGARAPEAMDLLADELGLARVAKPWGTERDGLVELSNWLAMVSGLLARMAGDLVILGRTEIGELFAGEGGGSSTMPQKANPVLPEALIALGRFNAGQAGVMAGTLFHLEDRDGTAWMTEWSVLPQMLVATGAGLAHANELAASLRPCAERMAATMEVAGGAIHAEALAFALARAMPLPEAQAMLKRAARSQAQHGGSLRDHLSPLCAARGVEMPVTDATDAIDNAERLVERLLAGLAPSAGARDE
ncbi:hypothetical protein H0I76_10195 [Limibaculum sp. M0105]|uniref:Fumarate lyase N-terminal domain-containing protein n=1 Tax=Thermohalobaculum xanthum TaxID=2753746 RepID=A0A8J7M772_9RHOB|nr:lyase family protein [Thermohalobaculum xanthum]MBK0399563.1 hypothetical protein [Thermohalobaculum xanthum]